MKNAHSSFNMSIFQVGLTIDMVRSRHKSILSLVLFFEIILYLFRTLRNIQFILMLNYLYGPLAFNLHVATLALGS
jgi:hypothetical protein